MALPVILASTSPYRQQLLKRLQIPFQAASPHCDETPLAKESPAHLAERLATEKATSLREQYPDHIIIGSDQVATLDNRQPIGKPGNHQRAMDQLRACSGKTVTFYTGLALYDGQSGLVRSDCVPYQVQFRHLTDTQIDCYLNKERPYDCAGSFKSEGLGIALFQQMQGTDPNSLIGLPLIRLVEWLSDAGLDPLA